MWTIENLEISVTYKVKLCDLNVPDDVYSGICKIQDERNGKIRNDVSIYEADKDTVVALEWLTYNIKESDSCEWNYEILDFGKNILEKEK